MLQTLVNRMVGRFLSALPCAFVAFLGLATGCTGCPEGQRPQAEALELAIKFARESFQQNSGRDLSAADLRVVGERYQQSDRAWYFQLSSSDDQCSIDVAVPDCEATESAGGGACDTQRH